MKIKNIDIRPHLVFRLQPKGAFHPIAPNDVVEVPKHAIERFKKALVAKVFQYPDGRQFFEIVPDNTPTFSAIDQPPEEVRKRAQKSAATLSE